MKTERTSADAIFGKYIPNIKGAEAKYVKCDSGSAKAEKSEAVANSEESKFEKAGPAVKKALERSQNNKNEPYAGKRTAFQTGISERVGDSACQPPLGSIKNGKWM